MSTTSKMHDLSGLMNGVLKLGRAQFDLTKKSTVTILRTTKTLDELKYLYMCFEDELTRKAENPQESLSQFVNKSGAFLQQIKTILTSDLVRSKLPSVFTQQKRYLKTSEYFYTSPTSILFYQQGKALNNEEHLTKESKTNKIKENSNDQPLFEQKVTYYNL
jgi:hypothetical protein